MLVAWPGRVAHPRQHTTHGRSSPPLHPASSQPFRCLLTSSASSRTRAALLAAQAPPSPRRPPKRACTPSPHHLVTSGPTRSGFRCRAWTLFTHHATRSIDLDTRLEGGIGSSLLRCCCAGGSLFFTHFQ